MVRIMLFFLKERKNHIKNKEDNAIPDDISIIINGLSLIGKKSFLEEIKSFLVVDYLQ